MEGLTSRSLLAIDKPPISQVRRHRCATAVWQRIPKPKVSSHTEHFHPLFPWLRFCCQQTQTHNHSRHVPKEIVFHSLFLSFFFFSGPVANKENVVYEDQSLPLYHSCRFSNNAQPCANKSQCTHKNRHTHTHTPRRRLRRSPDDKYTPGNVRVLRTLFCMCIHAYY